MEQKEQKFQCKGDCLNCRKQPNERREQWQYCAAQFTYNTMRMIQSMQETVNAMSGTIVELKEKVAAIQDSEALVYDPTEEEKSEIPNIPIAQEG